MRTGELGAARTRPKLRGNALFLALVAIPIVASVVVGLQVSSRMVGDGNDAQPPAAPPRVEASLGPTPIPAKEEAALRTVYADAEILSPEPMTPPPDSAAMNATSAALPVERGQVAAAPEPAVSELNTSSVTRPAAQDQTASIQPDASGAPLPDAPPPAEEPAETAAESTLVDLNTASLEELNDLGAGRIGRAIIRGRPYASAEDLVTKKVLRRSDFEKIKGLVAVEDRTEGEQALRR